MAKKKTDDDQDGKDDAEKSGGKLKKILIMVVALVVVGGAAYWFVLKPSGPVEAEPGEIVTLDPIQINLEGEHYLKVGLALQLTTTAHEVDGSKALDAAIELFSGRPMKTVAEAEKRKELKEKLAHELEESYHGDVMEVYFTEFVTQ